MLGVLMLQTIAEGTTRVSFREEWPAGPAVVGSKELPHLSNRDLRLRLADRNLLGFKIG